MPELRVSHISKTKQHTAGGPTGNQIPNEPLNVVASNPVSKRKQRPSIRSHVPPAGYRLFNPFPAAWFFLDKCVPGFCGEDRLSSGDRLRPLIRIIEFDA